MCTDISTLLHCMRNLTTAVDSKLSRKPLGHMSKKKNITRPTYNRISRQIILMVNINILIYYLSVIYVKLKFNYSCDLFLRSLETRVKNYFFFKYIRSGNITRYGEWTTPQNIRTCVRYNLWHHRRFNISMTCDYLDYETDHNL